MSTGYTFSASCAGIFRETDSSGSYDSATGKITYTVTSQTFSNQTVNFYINNSSGENLWSSSATLSYSSYDASVGSLSLNFSPFEITTNKCAVTLSNCQAGSIILTGTSTYFNRFVLTNSGYTIGTTSGKAE